MNNNNVSRRRAYAAGCFVVAMIFLSGCSLPRIAILNDPLSAEEHANLGRIYESQEKYDLAVQQYREAVRKDKKSAPALHLLADLSYKTENYSEAESAYKKAIKLEPGNGDLYNNLCWVYLDQHAGSEMTEELVRKALITTPEHRACYLDTLGVVLLRLGRTGESITALNEAVELLPKDQAGLLAEAYRHLAEAYRTAGDTVNALEAERSAEKHRVPKRDVEGTSCPGSYQGS
jgi:tetratricopeptide (TPR) repeat protein